MASYSFKDVGASIAGPGGSINLGMGSGAAEEGITFERTEDHNTMVTGADGEVMHSLHVSDSGSIRVRLLKTSPINGQLLNMYKAQRASAAQWGQNVISVRDFVRGDKMVASVVSFTGPPSLSFGKLGAVQEWLFHAGHIDPTLDAGVPPPTI